MLNIQQKNWVDGAIQKCRDSRRTKHEIMASMVFLIGDLWRSGLESPETAMHMHDYAFQQLFN